MGPVLLHLTVFGCFWPYFTCSYNILMYVKCLNCLLGSHLHKCDGQLGGKGILVSGRVNVTRRSRSEFVSETVFPLLKFK